MSRGLRCLTVVLLSLSLGSHWTLMQGIAWVSMFTRHVRTESVPVALGRTFDGQHPCSICKVVSAGQAAEEKGSDRSKIKQFELVPLTTKRMPLFATAYLLRVTRSVAVWVDRRESPPLPPPRSV